MYHSESASHPMWFALCVKPKHERTVAHELRQRHLEEYVPVYRERREWSDRVKLIDSPLFPGYVFCRFTYAERIAVLSTPGVTAILGAGKVFTPIADGEIAGIRRIVDSGVDVKPCPYLAPGDIVRVERGPLTGVRGTVLRIKGVHCVVISVELLRRSLAAEIDSMAVTPVPSGGHQQRLAACGGAANS